jgi:hypothetical protein
MQSSPNCTPTLGGVADASMVIVLYGISSTIGGGLVNRASYAEDIVCGGRSKVLRFTGSERSHQGWLVDLHCSGAPRWPQGSGRANVDRDRACSRIVAKREAAEKAVPGTRFRMAEPPTQPLPSSEPHSRARIVA